MGCNQTKPQANGKAAAFDSLDAQLKAIDKANKDLPEDLPVAMSWASSGTCRHDDGYERVSTHLLP